MGYDKALNHIRRSYGAHSFGSNVKLIASLADGSTTSPRVTTPRTNPSDPRNPSEANDVRQGTPVTLNQRFSCAK